MTDSHTCYSRRRRSLLLLFHVLGLEYAGSALIQFVLEGIPFILRIGVVNPLARFESGVPSDDLCPG